MAHKPIKYSENDIFEALKVYCSGASMRQYAINNNISPSTICRWASNFANDKLILNESLFTKRNLEDLGINSLEEFKEKFMKVYESNQTKGGNLTDDIKFNILKDYFKGVPYKKIEEKYNIRAATIQYCRNNFINGKLIFDESKLNGITKAEIDKLESQVKAMLDSGKKVRPDKYDDSVKLKIIKEYCGVDGNDEKTVGEVARNNKMSQYRVNSWIKDFVNGTLVFDEKQFKITKDEIEDLKIKASRINRIHSNDFKLTVLEEYLLEGITALDIQDKHGVASATVHNWYKDLRSNNLLNENTLNDSDKARLKILKEQAILREENEKIKDKYTDDFKNTIVKELLNGKTGAEIETIYKVPANTAGNWKQKFMKAGPFGADNLSEEEKEEFECLRQEEFKKREIDKLKKDGDFTWITYHDEDLKDWAEFANEFMKSLDRNINSYQSALNIFFEKFVIPIENNVSRDVGTFLIRNRNYNSPDFVEVCWGSVSDKSSPANCIIKFIEWILDNHCSDEDDYGNKHILEGFYNPLEKDISPGIASSSRLSESDKNVLPYRFIRDLRTTLCPLDAVSFADWTWVQENHNSSWFVVSEKFIDDVLKDFEKNGQDPDFVYRKRKNKRTRETVYEVWSPVAAVALFLKLTLPLRTYQVRMLDSGEADTEMYVQKDKTKPGEWVKNDCKLSNPNVKHPVTNGVLRKFKNNDFDIENAFEDSQLLSRKEMTGFFINTNKTADINKPANKKGYNIPWEHKELQYWIAKLRDWQKKIQSSKEAYGLDRIR